MTSAHSRRFRDLAALFDLTEDESVNTATTSLVQGMAATTSRNLSFVDQLKHQRQTIIDEEDDCEGEGDYDCDTNSVPQPHLSFDLLQQQDHHQSTHNNDYENSYRYPTQTLSADNDNYNYNYNDNAPSESSFVEHHQFDVRSSADLSMEAEAGKFWGGSTAQRFHTSSKRITQKGSLFRGRLNHRLRSRFGPSSSAALSEHQAQTTQNSDSDSDSNSNSSSVHEIEFEPSHHTHKGKDKHKQQHTDLVLNPTDSTDSVTCALSISTGTPTAIDGQSHSSHHTITSHSRSPSRNSYGSSPSMNRNLSYELASPERPARPPTSPLFPSSHHSHESPTRSESEAIEANDPVIPSWKLRQRQKMKERMKLLESPSLKHTHQPRTPPPLRARENMESSSSFVSVSASMVSQDAHTPVDRTPEAPLSAPALVTPPPPPRANRELATASAPSEESQSQSQSTPTPVAATEISSWKARQFRRTFRHRQTLRRNGSVLSEETSKPSEQQNGATNSTATATPIVKPEGKLLFSKSPSKSPIKRTRRNFQKVVVAEDEGSGERRIHEIPIEDPPPQSEQEHTQSHHPTGTHSPEQQMPVSPVKKLRSLFEPSERNNCENNRVVAYPSRSISKEVPEEDENDEDEDDVANSQPKGPQAPSVESVPMPILPQPAEWWTEMKERVDRYHGAVQKKFLNGNSDIDMDCDEDEDLRKAFEGFAENQNQLGRAMAVALFRGMELAQTKPQTQPQSTHTNQNAAESLHARELQDLRDQHAIQLRELRQQMMSTTNTNTTRATSSVVNTSNRNEAFRQRWKNRMNNGSGSGSSSGNSSNNGVRDDAHARPEYASTVVSNMSCRELSVDRYRAKLLQQMNRGKGHQKAPSTANTIAPSASIANSSDGQSSDGASAAGDSNTKNAEEIQRLLDELQQAERRQKLLEKQLQQAGVVLAEDIPYQLAKDKVAAISKRMNEIGSSDVVHEDPLVQKQLREEYFRLEKDMQKYLSALMLTDEFAEEQRREVEAWEAKHLEANRQALEAVRRHMPVDIRTLSPKQLEEDRGLPKIMVQKFRRTNVLQLLRVDPSVVAKWHPSQLEAFRVTGLTLTERRALYCYLQPVAEAWRGTQAGHFTGSADPMTTRKLAWYTTMRTNFQEALSKYERHLGLDGRNGTPRRHVHSTCLANRCDLVGNQCPYRANKAIDYFSNDSALNFPSHGVYEDPMVVVGKDARKSQKSPAEIIAAARGQPMEHHVHEYVHNNSTNNEHRSTLNPLLRKPTQHQTQNSNSSSTLPEESTNPRTKQTNPRHSSPSRSKFQRPKHPMMAKGPAKPGGLLAAIAARRID